MLLQYQILELIDAKASHNEVYAFGSEPCSLFQLALHAVLQCFFNSVFPVTLMHPGPGLSYMGMPARAHSAGPASSPALLRQTPLNLLSASGGTASNLFEMALIFFFF